MTGEDSKIYFYYETDKQNTAVIAMLDEVHKCIER